MATEPSSPEELDPRLAAAIADLRDREPEADLWPGVARRITARRPGTVVLRWPLAAAAAAVLVAAGSLATWQLMRRDAPAVVAVVDSAPVGAAPVLPAGFDRAEATLADAIAELERVYLAEAAELDPAVRTSIARSLAVLDSAIGEARTRAGATPDDLAAARYLTRTMQRKLHVLRTAATMARAS